MENDKDNQWRKEFIMYGGFTQLQELLLQCDEQPYEQNTAVEKKIISFLLKIMRNYLIAAFGNECEYIFSLTCFSKVYYLHLDIVNDVIDEIMGEIQQEELGKRREKMKALHYQFEDKRIATLQKLKENQQFIMLKENLKDKLGQNLIKSLDLSQFLQKTIKQMNSIFSLTEDFESEERQILEYGYQIVIAMLYFTPENLHLLGEAFTMQGLLCKNSQLIRRMAKHGLYFLAKFCKGGRFPDYLLDVLLRNVPKQGGKRMHDRDYTKFYELLCKMIEESELLLSPGAQQKFNYEQLLQQTIENYREHKSQEVRHNQHCDQNLLGYLNLIINILSLQCASSFIPKFQDFAKELLTTGLFDTTNS
eukprot:TRINITY_DN9313_c0_g1_i5.p1 TRINITY_DN9313_c0_g1~~TRINITY_DN9313_c0_g1_i5.p1  ORF type:complete len:363 (-),score=50.43 TRINITY_DN9313_c0_g1_i5:1240-2328(-)